jgi:dCTP deaminase
MFLSDQTLKKMLNTGEIFVDPKVSEKDIRPNGIRVYLDKTLIRYKDQVVDPTKDMDLHYETINLLEKPYALKPGEFVLGSTRESIQTPRHIIGFLDGRSTLARLGLTIHITASVTDGLYDEPRSITLEIYNAGNMTIILSHNMAIGSLSFSELDQPVFQPSQTQYRGQKDATPANIKGQFN